MPTSLSSLPCKLFVLVEKWSINTVVDDDTCAILGMFTLK